MTNNVRFPSNVGDTTRVVYNQQWARQVELVTLNAIFSVLQFCQCLQDKNCYQDGNSPISVNQLLILLWTWYKGTSLIDCSWLNAYMRLILSVLWPSFCRASHVLSLGTKFIWMQYLLKDKMLFIWFWLWLLIIIQSIVLTST